MGRLPIIWEDPYVGRLTIYRKMARLPLYGKASHVWENFPIVGSLPIDRILPMYGKPSHVWKGFLRLPVSMWEAVPFMGSLPTYGKLSHVWEVLTYMKICMVFDASCKDFPLCWEVLIL
jgi:hypothetical protein